jgi:hypothetical protein
MSTRWSHLADSGQFRPERRHAGRDASSDERVRIATWEQRWAGNGDRGRLPRSHLQLGIWSEQYFPLSSYRAQLAMTHMGAFTVVAARGKRCNPAVVQQRRREDNQAIAQIS